MAERGDASLMDALRLIDAGTGALGRNDRETAIVKYAKASEILFRHAKDTSEHQRKVQLAQRAQQLLQTVLALRRATGSDTVASETAITSAGGDAGREARAQRISFADVAGLEEVKETLHLRLIFPLRHPEKLVQFGLRAGGGLLLFGPPGTGKTMIAKAVAGELDLPFFAVKPSEILSKWVGESEQKLAALFDEARGQSSGAVIFVDEIDAIGASRSDSGASEASRRLLTQLLQELDGVRGRGKGLLFLAATNEPWLLDDALLRPGRFDEKCYVPLPDGPARLVILKLQLQSCRMAPDVDLSVFAVQTDGYSGADLMCLCERAKQIPFREAVLSGTDRALNESDLRQAKQHVRPSVSVELLQRFREYATA